jgi:hypothetical protein
MRPETGAGIKEADKTNVKDKVSNEQILKCSQK